MKAVRLENFGTKTPPGKSAEEWRRKKKNLTGTGWSSAPAESGETGGKDTGAAGTPPERRPTYSEIMQGYYGDRDADALAENKTAADAAADQNIHALLGKKACQCAVAGSVGSDHFAGNHLIVFYFVNLKILCFSKMLENIPVIVCNCNFHLTKSSVVFSYASFSCIKASIWSGSRIRFSERTSHPSSVIRISSSIRIPISHSSI